MSTNRIWIIETSPVDIGDRRFGLYTAVDAETGKIGAHIVIDGCAEASMEVLLQRIIAAYGTPWTIITDKSLPFTRASFGEFLRLHGIRHEMRRPLTDGYADIAARLRVLREEEAIAAARIRAETVGAMRRIARGKSESKTISHVVSGMTPEQRRVCRLLCSVCLLRGFDDTVVHAILDFFEGDA